MTLSGPGTTCLKNATQDGAITVMNGHELSVVDSKITGAVTSIDNVPFVIAVIPAEGSLMASNVNGVSLATTASSTSSRAKPERPNTAPASTKWAKCRCSSIAGSSFRSRA